MPPSPTPPTSNSASLAAHFAELCIETDFTPSPLAPTLPGLTPTESSLLLQTPAGELYLSPQTLPSSPSESVLKALQHAVAHTISPSNYSPLLSHPTLPQPPPTPPKPTQSFTSLFNCAPSNPHASLRTLSWGSSLSRETLASFTEEWRQERAQQSKRALEEAEQAMARAKKSTSINVKPPKPPAQSSRRHSFTSDPVLWAAQEEAAASAVLRDLRTSLSKLRKGSSKSPPEGSAIWNMVSARGGKLKPEAAAEMARARMAAAAAVAAMKGEEAGVPMAAGDSLGEVVGGMDHVRLLEGDVGRAEDVVCPGFPRAVSLEGGRRLRGDEKKKKRVDFVEGTKFGKRE